MSRVLVIGDLHCPADLNRYRQHCQRIRDKYKTNRTVFIGDIVDAHRWGRWDPHHDADSPPIEYKKSLSRVDWWHRNFPDAIVTIGNHDERAVKQARSCGIPDNLVKGYADAWDTPSWKWCHDVEIDGVRYFHGEGFSGKSPHVNAAMAAMKSTVMGHIHGVSGIQYISRPGGRYFGMAVGCGVDIKHPYMAYAEKHPTKPVLSCGVVIDGKPYLEVL
jgi:predicted phosphodiesterase